MRALLPFLLVACAHPAPPSVAKPQLPLTMTYLGVAGWQIEAGGKIILVDPYFSRPPKAGPGDTLLPDEAAIAAHAPARADLVLVGHSHIDHLLDVPAIALRTGAQIVGSRSTARVALAAGVPADQVIPVLGGEDYALHGYSVRVLRSLHSALDEKHFEQGVEIPAGVKLPLTFDGYAEGGTFGYLVRIGGWEVLVLSTANFIERELEGLRPDIVITGVGLREELHDFSCRLMRALGNPPRVYASHFDAWQKPLGPEQMAISEGAQKSLAAFPEEIRACSPATKVVIPKHFEPIRLP
jgi:L-ascorbate metabolism protein UlaG (beta-lactamase superfamily)